MIADKHFIAASTKFNLPEALIRAVADVEARGSGFLNGLPLILFEPHVFYRELRKEGIDPEPLAYIKVPRKIRGKIVLVNQPHPVTGDIVYATWGERAYGSSINQHRRLERASAIHREAALRSASWGLFQIMGFNWEACGCSSLQEFINRIYQDEEQHLLLFLQFLQSTRTVAMISGRSTRVSLLEVLRLRLWAEFAEGYNGPRYKENAYHLKLERAFNKYLVR